jgi:radical SAM protein with 4Fe4S-binding SPASM domain
MSLRILYEGAVRKYREDGFSSLISSGYYYAIAKVVQHSPTFAGIFAPKVTLVAIEPTNVCNLRCRVCYSQNPVLQTPRQRGFMELETYKRIIDELSTYGYTIELWLGFAGEPLLHRNFLDMVDYAASKGVFRIGFDTNGMLLNDNLARALINKVDTIGISLDGLGKVNDSIRLGADYEVIRRNILDLVEKRGDRRRPQIRINLVRSTQSEKDILEFLRFWTGIVDCVWGLPWFSEDLRAVNPVFSDEAPTKEDKVCTYPFYYLAVLWNGDVVPCCIDLSGVNILGNASKDTIANIWRGKPYRALRRAAARGTFSPQSRCHHCERASAPAGFAFRLSKNGVPTLIHARVFGLSDRGGPKRPDSHC